MFELTRMDIGIRDACCRSDPDRYLGVDVGVWECSKYIWVGVGGGKGEHRAIRAWGWGGKEGKLTGSHHTHTSYRKKEVGQLEIC